MSKKYPVIELFGPTIQGEGAMTGTLSHFLRLGGCSLRCDWCDSLDAVIPERIKRVAIHMSLEEINMAVKALPYAPWLTLTGGDPCIHPGLNDFILMMNGAGVNVAVETQGMHFPDWLLACDHVTFSPKGPGSGKAMDIQPLVDWFKQHHDKRPPVTIKVVVASIDEESMNDDITFINDIIDRIPPSCYDQFWVNAVSIVDDCRDLSLPNMAAVRQLETLAQYQMLTDYILKSNRLNISIMGPKFHIGCQQHVLLFPHAQKGV